MNRSTRILAATAVAAAVAGSEVTRADGSQVDESFAVVGSRADGTGED